MYLRPLCIKQSKPNVWIWYIKNYLINNMLSDSLIYSKNISTYSFLLDGYQSSSFHRE